MDSSRFVVVLLILSLVSKSFSQSIIQITPQNHGFPGLVSGSPSVKSDDALYCESWRYSVETNDAGIWEQIPESCVEYVKGYMTGDRYLEDSEFVAYYSLAFAKTVEVAGDGRDAWIFDVDETLLSNLPYYADHRFGSEVFDENSFDEWVDLAEAPALPASLKLYNELQKLGFTIILLTGRSETQRNVTEKNLLYSGYRNWKKLILRGLSDSGKLAIVYKSEKRMGVKNEGYIIHGNSGDQWSDLNGLAVSNRSFKLPNPMYYIS